MASDAPSTALESRVRTLTEGGQLPLLDGVRGLAIALVMAFHVTRELPSWPRYTFFGWCGVDLFFVLSGFLITGILLDSRERSRYFVNFYARRFLRICPLYWAFLLCFFAFPALQYRSVPLENSPIYWLYGTNFRLASVGWQSLTLDVTWSLAIEEQFYLVWPLVVWLVPRRWLPAVCGALIVTALGLRLEAGRLGWSGIAVYVLPWTRMDALAAGGLAAVLVRSPLRARFTAAAKGLFPLGAAVLLGLYLHDVWTHQRAYFSDGGTLMRTYGFTGLAVVYALFLLALLDVPEKGLVERAIAKFPLGSLGRYSYALYLLHLPVAAAIRGRLDAAVPGWAQRGPWQVGFVALAVLATCAAAFCSWHLFEKQVLKLKRFVSWNSSAQGPRRSEGGGAALAAPE